MLKLAIPSGKHAKNYGKIHHFLMGSHPLFRLGHVQVRKLLT